MLDKIVTAILLLVLAGIVFWILREVRIRRRNAHEHREIMEEQLRKQQRGPHKIDDYLDEERKRQGPPARWRAGPRPPRER